MKAANKNTIPITSESDILCAFRNLTSSYDERTLHKWINFGSITNFVGFPIPLVALSAHIE